MVGGTGLTTVVFEGNEQVFPCRCGETHRGPHAIYDYGHHNCFHDAPLSAIEEEDGHYMCPQCGKDFWLAIDHDGYANYVETVDGCGYHGACHGCDWSGPFREDKEDARADAREHEGASQS